MPIGFATTLLWRGCRHRIPNAVDVRELVGGRRRFLAASLSCRRRHRTNPNFSLFDVYIQTSFVWVVGCRATNRTFLVRDIRCFGVVNGVMVLADYCLVITWLPACLIFYEKHLKHCCCTSACAAKLLKTTANAATAAPDDDPDGPPHAAAAAGRESRVEAFYGGPFARFILKFCKPLTASVAVLLQTEAGATKTGDEIFRGNLPLPCILPRNFFFLGQNALRCSSELQMGHSSGLPSSPRGFFLPARKVKRRRGANRNLERMPFFRRC